jgi:hypothetical protein
MIDLSDKLQFRPNLPVDPELVTIFTEFIVKLDYSFWNLDDFDYGKYD